MRSQGTHIAKEQQVLESVAIKGHLQGLCLSHEVTQVFVNKSGHNIEAVYTFPLPQGAVLLDLSHDHRGGDLPPAVRLAVGGSRAAGPRPAAHLEPA